VTPTVKMVKRAPQMVKRAPELDVTPGSHKWTRMQRSSPHTIVPHHLASKSLGLPQLWVLLRRRRPTAL
jgi:hypothetical protein